MHHTICIRHSEVGGNNRHIDPLPGNRFGFSFVFVSCMQASGRGEAAWACVCFSTLLPVASARAFGTSSLMVVTRFLSDIVPTCCYIHSFHSPCLLFNAIYIGFNKILELCCIFVTTSISFNTYLAIILSHLLVYSCVSMKSLHIDAYWLLPAWVLTHILKICRYLHVFNEICKICCYMQGFEQLLCYSLLLALFYNIYLQFADNQYWWPTEISKKQGASI